MSTVFDQQIVEEFRATRGRVSGPLAGVRVMLLTTTDATTGDCVTVPVRFLHDTDDRTLIIAAPAGGDSFPTWYGNLLADPRVSLETGTFNLEAQAQVLEEEDRDLVFARAVDADPALVEVQARMDVPIPVVALTPVSGEPVEGDLWGVSLKAVHDGFRRELALIRKEFAAIGPEIGVQLRINCLAMCGVLHHHHTTEDAEMFPTVDRHHPELTSAMARLRVEHIAMQALIEDLQRAISDETADPKKMRSEVERLTAQVEAHLDYEEEQLIPVLNKLLPEAVSAPPP